MPNIYEINYSKLTRLVDLDELIKKGYLKYTAKGFMDLNLDYLYTEENGNIVIAMSHNYIQNGDLMADPDMEIRIIPEMKSIEALSFQQDGFPNIYQTVYVKENNKTYVNPKLKKQLNSFLRKWLTTLSRQGYTKVEKKKTKTLQHMTIKELKAYARKNNIKGYSGKRKADLIAYIQAYSRKEIGMCKRMGKKRKKKKKIGQPKLKYYRTNRFHNVYPVFKDQYNRSYYLNKDKQMIPIWNLYNDEFTKIIDNRAIIGSSLSDDILRKEGYFKVYTDKGRNLYYINKNNKKVRFEPQINRIKQ